MVHVIQKLCPCRCVGDGSSQLLSDIQVLILSKNGESPYYREYDHAGVCVKRFGKWSTAVEKAREDPYNTMEFAKEIWGKMQITY